MAILEEMLTSAVLPAGIKDVLQRCRQSFKTQSNQGFVWHKKRHKDLGNVRYAILYQFLFRLACHTQAPVTGLFQELEGRYTSLGMQAPITTNSAELRGDVIEVILACCRFTGPEVDDTVRQTRVRFNELMLQFSQVLESILCIIFSGNDGPPRNHHWPDADLFVIVLYGAHAWHAERDRVKQEEMKQAFEQNMTQALRSVNSSGVGRSRG